MVLNLQNARTFNNRAEIYQARDYEKNYFLIEKNNNYQIVRFNSTLEKVIKMAYYIFNPFVQAGINPFKSTSNVEKRFEASLIESKEVVKKTLPQMREEFYAMVSNAKKEDIAGWYKDFNAMRVENQKRLLANYDNLDLLSELYTPCQAKIGTYNEKIGEIDRFIVLVEELQALHGNEPSEQHSKSLQNLSREVEEARRTRDFLVQQKDIYETDRASKEFEAEINKFFKDKINTLILDFYNSSELEKLDKGAELLIFAEALATATEAGDILDYETEKEIRKHYKSTLGNAEKKEVKARRKQDPAAFQKELIAYLFRSIETHCKQMQDEMTSGNTLHNITTFVELHLHEQKYQFLTPFYKTWSIRTKTKGRSPIMRSAQQAAAALRGLYQKPRGLQDWTHFLVKEEKKHSESSANLRNQIEKDEVDFEQRGQELELTQKAMNLLKRLDSQIVIKFAGTGFSPFYAFLIQLIDHAKNIGEDNSFEKETLDAEDLQNLGFRKTSNLTLTNGIYLFSEEFRDLILTAKKMAQAELTRLRDPLSYRQIVAKSEKNNDTLQQHPEHPKYRNRLNDVQSEIANQAQFLVEWYQKSEGSVFRPQDLSVEVLENRFRSLQKELEEAKNWKPNSFDFFSDTEALAAENKKKIETLTHVLHEYTQKFDRLKSLTEYRNLLLTNETLTKQIVSEREKIYDLSGARIETLLKYIDLLNTFDECTAEASALLEQNPAQDAAEAIKNAQLAKVRLEDAKSKLKNEINDLINIQDLKEKFINICKLLHLE